ncbi:hypothetical protein N782_07440 [Pontibacillus yanchengensis Y32]|uniref:Uncharacterized protein n=2 Tax=Pontibacillus yanchengensis TaxID=462910 RepID=A0A0A2TF92_9BACI|nr:hypothetical protein N782_07440 [Pontibacillus yanchengensis Y32]
MLYLIITSIMFIFVTIMVPKRLTKIEIYASTFSALYLQLVVDVYLHIKLNWYYYLTEHTIDWATMFVIPIFVGVNVLFLNYYPFGKSGSIQFSYITICIFFSMIYEYYSIQFGMMLFNEWKLWYSVLAYYFLFPLLALNLTWIRHLLEEHRVFNSSNHK